jgi:hypothetical protein
LDNSAFWAEVEYAWKRFINIVFRTPWHWFRCNFIPKHRYHILDLRKGGNNYSWGWYDTDSRMLQACFLLLKEYVEKEQPFNNADWNWNEDHKHAGEEIKYLYEWWTVKRPEAKAKLAYDWEHEPYDTHFIKLPDGGYKIMQPESVRTLVQREDDMSAEDQRNLERLIKIRGFLWT